MLPTLHHGVSLNNQSRLEYQSNNLNTNQISILDGSDTRVNKSRLLEYGGVGAGGNGGGGAVAGANYSNEHLHSQAQSQQHNQYSKAQNKYGSDYSHLPHIRQND